MDVETGNYQILDYLAVADVGTVHPSAQRCGGQILGRSMLGIGHAIGQKWVYDQHYGVPLAKRFYSATPPTILDVPTASMKWAALDIPDPETPVGARGIGEPPVGAGCVRGAERDFGCGRRRNVPPRAGDARHDSDVARSRASGARSR